MEQLPEQSNEVTAGVRPQQREQRASRRPMTWLWVLLAFVAGLVLPALACFGLLFAVGAMSSTGSTDPSLGFGPGVGVIRVEGVIMPGKTSDLLGQGVGSDTIVSLIEQAQANSDVKAILLRVDSPGGGVVASDEIYHALTQVDKPIVVSMGTVAASGGYYISAPADYIIATPHTLTGSIGVISSFVNAQDLLSDVGVDVVVLTTGDYKDTGSLYREMTEAEKAYWRTILDDSYQGFVGIVAEGRGLSEDDVLQLADGRVYTGQQALDAGLVDELGYFDDALEKAADLGGITGEPRIIEMQAAPGLFDYIQGAQAQRGFLPTALDIMALMSQPRLEYRYVGP